MTVDQFCVWFRWIEFYSTEIADNKNLKNAI